MATRANKLERAEREAKLAELRLRTRVDTLRYEALSTSFPNSTRPRIRPGPRPSGGSGQSHRDATSRGNLRKDCQDAYRNNPIAQAVVDRKVELVVGAGPVLQVQSEDDDFNAEAERLFGVWASACDITGQHTLTDLLEQAVAAWYTDGRHAWLKVRSPEGDGVLQAIEDERLRNPAGKIDDERCAAGVEMDAVGRPLRYHVAEWSRQGTYPETRTLAYEPVYVVYLKSPRCRTSNVVAPEPVLASVLDWLELIDETVESTVIAYRVATLLSLVRTSDNPQDAQAALLAGLSNDEYNSGADSGDPSEIELQPGMMLDMKTGGTISQVVPQHPATHADKFAWMLVQLIAARAALPIDLTHFIMDRNWSGTRSRMAVAWRGVQAEQRGLCRALRDVSRWKVAEWINDGRLWPAAGWDRCAWVPAPMPMLDPAMELKTRREAIDARLMDYQQAMEETGGRDWYEMESRLAKQVARLRADGIEPVVAGNPVGAQVGDVTAQGTPENVGG